MIIDCHTHWGEKWSRRSGADPSDWLKVLDRHGIDKAWVMCGIGLTRLDCCDEDNRIIAKLAEKAPDRIVPVATVWPQHGSQAIKDAKKYIRELGMRALKFHPWLQGFSVADPVFADICSLAGELNVPVIFHDGTPPFSLSEQIGGLARRFPDTRFVLGHAGILWGWRSALAAARHPNLWLCLCGPHRKAMEIFCSTVDHNRLLWGSDFGFGLADSYSYRLGLVKDVVRDDIKLQRILEENPRQLLAQ